MYLLPVKTEIDYHDGLKINVTEITDLLRYWPILEILGKKLLDYLKVNFCHHHVRRASLSM